jgi:aconitate hydratase
VGRFVEFYGKGVAEVPPANRATLGNMSPESGSTAAIFPIDEVTVDYLRLTGRTDDLALVEAYAKRRACGTTPRRSPSSPSTSNSTLSTWCRPSPSRRSHIWF